MFGDLLLRILWRNQLEAAKFLWYLAPSRETFYVAMWKSDPTGTSGLLRF